MTGQGDRGDEAYQVGVGVARLYLRHRPGLAPWRDDLTSDSLLGATKALRDYDPERGSFSAYVALRARGEIIDGIRARATVSQHRRRQGLTLDDLPQVLHTPVELSDVLLTVLADPRSADPYTRVDDRDAVERLLRTLPPRLRHVVVEVYLHDRMIRRDVATEMNLSEYRIWQLLAEALGLMRESATAA